MNAGTEIDIKALSWVKGEISQTLEQIRQAMELYVETPSDSAKLEFVVSHIHQIAGTLNIVELYGAALLAEEMEHLAQALAKGQIKQKDDAYEVLTRGILQLPTYLEHLLHGHRDHPLILLPLLNDLRAAHGQQLLSENALFAPDLTISPPPRSGPTPPPGAGNIRALAKKLRTVYQSALVGYLRNSDPANQLKKLSFVLAQIGAACDTDSARRLWWIAQGVLEGLMDKGLQPSISIKNLLGQIDRQIKKLVDSGEDAQRNDPPKELLKNLLFYVAQITPAGPCASELKEKFRLAELLPDQAELDIAHDNLLGLNSGVMDNVTAALREDLMSIKDTIDLFVRSKEHPLTDLEPVAAKLRTIADTLGILGLGKLRKTIKDQESAIDDVLAGKQQVTEPLVLSIASSLLYVESAVSGLKSGHGPMDSSASDSDAESLPDGEYHQLIELTVKEARGVLAQVKDAIMLFAARPGSYEPLQPVPELINTIKGALLVVGYSRAADLLNLAGQYISRDLLEQHHAIDQDHLDTLADIITGIEFFLESVEDDPVGARNTLELVQRGLERLGYGAPLDGAGLQASSLPVKTERGPYSPPAEKPVLPASEIVLQPLKPVPVPPPAKTSAQEPPQYDEEVLEIFLEEAGEEFESIKQNIRQWRANPADDNPLRTLRRSFHTIKGSGRIVGAMEIGEFAWGVENMLNRVIDRNIPTSPGVFAVLDAAQDMLPLLIEALRRREKSDQDIQPLIEHAQRIAQGEEEPPPAPAELETIEDIDIVLDSEQLIVLESAEDIISDAQFAPVEDSSYTPRYVDPTLAEIFTNETRTHLNTLSEFISRCSPPQAQCALTEGVIRALHTLHGSAHMANIEEIADLSDALEKWAKVLLDNNAVVEDEILSLLSGSVEIIDQALLNLSDTRAILPKKAKILERLSASYREALDIQKERLSTLGAALGTHDTLHAVDLELLDVFLGEAVDVIHKNRVMLEAWEETPQQPDFAEEIRRNLHVLHGGARIANAVPIADVCSATSAILTHALNGSTLAAAVVELTKAAHHWMHDAIEIIKDRGALATPVELLNTLESFRTGGNTPMATEAGSGLRSVSEEMQATEPDFELKGIFLDEATEILVRFEAALQRWNENFSDMECISELQRTLHTLKGGARMAQVTPIGDLSHELENLLTRIADKELPLGEEIFTVAQAAHDWIVHGVELLRNNSELSPATELLNRIQTINSGNLTELPPAIFHEGETTSAITPPAPLPNEPEYPTNVRRVIPFPKTEQSTWEEEAHYDDELVDVFLEEAEELSVSIDELVARWAKDTSDKKTVAELQRALHTLKGGARMAKVVPVGDLSHSIESVLESIMAGRVAASHTLVDLVHSAHDWLVTALERVRAKAVITPATHLIHQIEAAVGLRSAPAASEDFAQDSTAAFEPERASEDNAVVAALMEARTAAPPGMQPGKTVAKAKTGTGERVGVELELLDHLVNNAGEVSIYRSRIELQLNSVRYNLTELAQTVNRLREQLRKFEIEAEAQILFRYEKAGNTPDKEEFDPLELDRFSNMQQLSRSLVESTGDLSSIQKLLDNYTRESEILLLQQSRVSTVLQEGLMRTRLVPFSSVVPRLRRIVRQTAKELGKQVELDVTGAEGEMDRSVLSRLTPALEHMLRNAVDHGIETPQQRAAAHKPPIGHVSLHFWLEGAEIVLNIQDDGAGMNLAAIRAKAIEKGLMARDADLGDNEVTQFVLEAGFSTAQHVTQISGRGVGMDVVNNEIKQLSGILNISSESGKGSTFVIRLPLTVSVNQALIVHAGDQTYAIALSAIDGVVRVGRDELQKMQENEGLDYEYGGQRYHYFHLGHILNVAQLALPDVGTKIPLILARAGDHRVGLHVESIVSRQEVVIKSVGPLVSTVGGISGATILSDGGVALILDIAALIRTGIAMARLKMETGHSGVEPIAVAERLLSIMIVDDSITVRKVTERLLKRHSFETITAKDGMDALDQLQEYIPDVMLLDVEMPRMDGYELATAMRNDTRLKDIPIIMITSRTGAKHRDRAMAIGVNMYMGKPYQDTELLENIKVLLDK